MAYDPELAERIRQLTGGDAIEKKMFGGLAFLVGGHMAVTASHHGGVMIRVDPAESAGVVADTGATVVEMRGRPMPGWLYLEPAELSSDEALAAWVDHGLRYARSLPAKG